MPVDIGNPHAPQRRHLSLVPPPLSGPPAVQWPEQDWAARTAPPAPRGSELSARIGELEEALRRIQRCTQDQHGRDFSRDTLRTIGAIAELALRPPR